MKLYYAETLNPRKACAVARYLGAPVEFVRVDIAAGEQRRPAYRAINPNGKVPALVDGGRTLWEADAIMCYLAERAGSDLWPKDDRQIDVIRWLSWGAHHLTQYAGQLYFQNLIKPQLGMGAPDPIAVEQASNAFRQFAAVLDEHLSSRSFVVGDALTVADFALGASLPYAEAAKIPVDDFAHIGRWHARLSELSAWREPFPFAAADAA